MSGLALVIVQNVMLGQPVWITATAIVLSAPLALVGLRVLGETNWGPISALSNMMQGVFALLTPGNIAANMIASGTTGTVAVESEAIMQDYKAGDMIGSSPRYLTYMQLLATPVGAAAVSWMYPGLAQPIRHRREGLELTDLAEMGGLRQNPFRRVRRLTEGRPNCAESSGRSWASCWLSSKPNCAIRHSSPRQPGWGLACSYRLP